jgi:hypothetical protein
LLHEVGHWVDFNEKVVVPAALGHGELDSLSEGYFSRAHAEREKFAHNYAEVQRAHLMKFGVIPLSRFEV